MNVQTHSAKTGQDTEALLRIIVKDFSVAPLANGKRMRDLMSMDFDAFRIAAVSVLHDESDVRGSRYLVTLLWTHELLIPTLSDTSLPKELSISVAKTAASVDPQLHIRLTKFLVTGMLEGQEIEEAAASRLLEVLSAISDPAGIQPFLRQMLLHPSPRIRSKITLLVGRGQAGIRALEKLLRDEDARVRANAVEALWTNQDPQAVTIFREFANDTNNRVIGNAVLGLYLTGDTYAISATSRLASHANAIFRATAVWIMGKTKDPRFVPLLGRLLGESKGQLRKTVFNSLDVIKKAGIQRTERPRLDVEILSTEESGQRVRVLLMASLRTRWELVDVKPTELVVYANQDLICEYSCTEHRSEFLSLALVLPRRPNAADNFRVRLEAGLKKCLDAKPRGEQWTIIRFSEEDRQPVMAPLHLLGQSLTGQPAPAPKAPPVCVFTANSPSLDTILHANGIKSETGFSVSEAVHCVLASAIPPRGDRILLLVVDSPNVLDADERDGLVKAVLRACFSVCVISTHENIELAQVCRETSGFFRMAANEDKIESEIILLYKSLHRRHVVDFSGRDDGSPIDNVTVHINRLADVGDAKWQRPV